VLLGLVMNHDLLRDQ